MMLSFQTFRQIFAAFDPGREVGRSFEIPSIEPAKDGWVGFCTITSQQYSDFCSLIGAPELAAPEIHVRRSTHGGTRCHLGEDPRLYCE